MFHLKKQEMKIKSQLVNTNETWNAKKRYKINSVVSYLGITYQNGSGKNSDPSLNLGDWIVISGESVGLEEAPIDGLQYARQDATWTEVTGGGSQDLQSVLDNGSDAIDKYIGISSSSNDEGIVLSPNSIQLNDSIGNSSFLVSGEFQLNVTGISTSRNTSGETFNNNDVGGSVVINKLPNTAGTRTFNYPIAKPDGYEGTLATLDDITAGAQDLQSVVDTGNTLLDSYLHIEAASGIFLDISSLNITATQPDYNDTGYGIFSSIEAGRIIGQNYTVVEGYSNLYLNLLRNSNGDINFNFPEKPAGTYTVAVDEDVLKVYTDTTTVVLSEATLDSSYPTAKTGDRVHAISIIAGALMYEKTSTGWVGFPVAVIV